MTFHVKVKVICITQKLINIKTNSAASILVKDKPDTAVKEMISTSIIHK